MDGFHALQKKSMGDLYGELASFQLALMGIMVSVLTLVFAVVVSKRDEIRAIKDCDDLRLSNRRTALTNSIGTLSNFCRQIIAIIIILLVMYLGSMALRIVDCKMVGNWIDWLDGLATVAVMVWVIKVAVMVWRNVNKD